MKFNSLFIQMGLFFFSFVSTPCLADFSSASTRGIMGGISNLYLSPDGFEVNIMNNDFLGGTDKYMTGGMSYGWLHSLRLGESHNILSYEILASWDALTPGTSESVGGRPLPRTLGRFADWMSGRGSLSYTFAHGLGRSKVQLSLGLGHIGHKGMKNLHYAIHSGIGMQTSGLEYDNQPAGFTRDYDLYVGHIMGDKPNEWMIGGGVAYNKAMRDFYLRANYLRDLTQSYKLSLELSLVRQMDSQIYDGIAPMRYEAAVALRIHEYYQPGFKFVSSFLKEDPRGQFYAELLRFNIPM